MASLVSPKPPALEDQIKDAPSMVPGQLFPRGLQRALWTGTEARHGMPASSSLPPLSFAKRLGKQKEQAPAGLPRLAPSLPPTLPGTDPPWHQKGHILPGTGPSRRETVTPLLLPRCQPSLSTPQPARSTNLASVPEGARLPGHVPPKAPGTEVGCPPGRGELRHRRLPPPTLPASVHVPVWQPTPATQI